MRLTQEQIEAELLVYLEWLRTCDCPNIEDVPGRNPWLARAELAHAREEELLGEIERLNKELFPDAYLSYCGSCNCDTLGQDGMCSVCQFDEIIDYIRSRASEVVEG